jgi:O-antigen ligase
MLDEESSRVNNFFWKHIHISEQSACVRWSIGLFLTMTTFSFAGSGGSFGAIIMAIFALNYWFYAPIFLNRNEITTAWVVSFYMAVVLFIGYLNDNGLTSMWLGLSNIGLITLILLLPAIRYCDVARYKESLHLTFPVSALIMVLGLFIEYYTSIDLERASLLSGNPLILALIASTSAIGCIVFGYHSKRWYKILHFVGFLSSSVALIATGSRGPLAATIILCTGYMLYKSIINKSIKPVFILMSLIILLALVFINGNQNKIVQKLVDRSVPIIETLKQKKSFKSLDKSSRMRVSYYQSGYKLLKDNPIYGVGRSNLIEQAKAKAPKSEKKWYNKTHLHNGFLSHTISNGILGLVSLIILLFLPIHIARGCEPKSREFALLLTTFLFMYSFFNISFFHDVMVFLFVIQCTFISLYKTS